MSGFPGLFLVCARNDKGFTQFINQSTVLDRNEKRYTVYTLKVRSLVDVGMPIGRKGPKGPCYPKLVISAHQVAEDQHMLPVIAIQFLVQCRQPIPRHGRPLMMGVVIGEIEGEQIQQHVRALVKADHFDVSAIVGIDTGGDSDLVVPIHTFVSGHNPQKRFRVSTDVAAELGRQIR